MQPFIKYLAELISEDADLNSSGSLIYESDARRRDLERKAAFGDPEAAEALKIYLKRSGQQKLTFEEIFDKYCEIVGYRPEGFNAFTEKELLMPGPEEDLTADPWDNERLMALQERTSEIYENLMANKIRHQRELISWLQNQYIKNPRIINGLAKLIQSIWLNREYLDGKIHIYGPNGLSNALRIDAYQERLGQTINKLRNRVEVLLGQSEEIDPTGNSTRRAYFDTRIIPQYEE